MVLLESFDTKNMKTKDYLNIRKLWFTFALGENATLEIILYDKFPNIMLKFGCSERRKGRVSSFNSISPNHGKHLIKC